MIWMDCLKAIYLLKRIFGRWAMNNSCISTVNLFIWLLSNQMNKFTAEIQELVYSLSILQLLLFFNFINHANASIVILNHYYFWCLACCNTYFLLFSYLCLESKMAKFAVIFKWSSMLRKGIGRSHFFFVHNIQEIKKFLCYYH